MILVCIQFALSAWSLSLREELPGAAKLQMDASYAEFKHMIGDHTHIWHKMQYELQCCGIYELTDYFRTDGISVGAVGVPWSCCKTPTEAEQTSCNTFHQRGCLHILSETIRDRLFYVSLVLIVAAIVQSMGLFCIIQLTFLLNVHEQQIKDTTDMPSTSRSRESRHRRNKELLPLSQKSTSVPESQKY